MPILSICSFARPTREQFHEVDHLATGLAFAIHNAFGRLMDEKLYQTEMLRRLHSAGMDAYREVKITAAHDTFRHDYFLDILVAPGVVLETKAVEQLLPQHEAQLLHYLFLCELPHGTLLNYRAARVEHRFVSTHHTLATRRAYQVDATRWRALCPEMTALKDRTTALFDDWGCLLEAPLYREALTHFLGTVRAIEIHSEGHKIGSQSASLLTEDIAFTLTTVRLHADMESHLRRLLSHTSLRAIAWINLHQTNLSFTTLSNE